MATLADFRAQYPQYEDIPDAALADSLHKKFYADMPKMDFYKSLGLGSEIMIPGATTKAPAATKPDRSAMDVIGGILETADKQDEARVPGLASLPVFGRLFQSEQVTQRKTELLIFVTPRVLAESPPRAASNTLRDSFQP